MEISQSPSSVSSVSLVAGVRAVFEMAGFAVSDALGESEKFDLVAKPPSGPVHAVACCGNAEDFSIADLEEVCQSAEVSGHQGVDVISKGQFSEEVKVEAERLGVQLTSGDLFLEAVGRLPEDTLQSLTQDEPKGSVSPVSPFQQMIGDSNPSEFSSDFGKEDSTLPRTSAVPMNFPSPPHDVTSIPSQSHQAAPSQRVPAQPVPLYDDPKPKGKGKGCLIAGIIGAVLFLGLVLVAVVAAIAIPNIAAINDAAKEAKGLRIAQNYASIASSADAVGLDFVQSPDATVSEVMGRLSAGLVVDDPGGPFHDTFFGVPRVSPEDQEMAERFLEIKDGRLELRKEAIGLR